MAFLLYVRRGKESDETHRLCYHFIQNVVTLGDDITNNLRLRSGQKSISSVHAQIHEKNGRYFLSDCGSQEGTYFGEEKLFPGRPYVIDEGMEFRIGDYFITFVLADPSERNDLKHEISSKTAILNEMTNLADVLESLNGFSEKSISVEENEYLQHIINDVFADRNVDKMNHLLKKSILHTEHRGNGRLDDKNEDFIIDVLFKLFIRLFELGGQISDNFVGSHTVHRKDSRQLISLNNLKKYVFDTELTPSEREERRKFLRDQIDDLISRFNAICSGYQYCLKHGTEDLLKKLDLKAAKEEVVKKCIHLGPIKIPYRLIPFLICRRALQNMLEIHHELTEQKFEEIERCFFKPAFVKGYLQSIQSDLANHSTEKV